MATSDQLSNQLNLMGVLRTFFTKQRSLRPFRSTKSVGFRSTKSVGRPTLLGTVEGSQDGSQRYSLNVSIKRRPGEKGAYHLDCADLAKFIDAIYPGYVRGDEDQDIQVEFHPDEASNEKSKIFHTYNEFMKYNEAEELGIIIGEPAVDISYIGANTDVPKRISLTRQPLSRFKTDYTIVVEVPEAYNLLMIDVCVNSLFNQRTKLSSSGRYR